MYNQYDDGKADVDRGVACYQQGNYLHAYMCFRDGAEKGNAAAMHNLSVLTMNGQGTPKNEEQAFVWMERAAKAGNVASYYTLASKFYNGTGTVQNMEQAGYWAKMAMNYAAEPDKTNGRNLYNSIIRTSGNGDPELQEGMRYYQQGNYSMTRECFLRAVNKGNAAAMNNMSILYLNGQGVEKDPAAAFEWMKKAAEAGYAHSLYPLASKYYRGFGTPKDLGKAREWAMKVSQSAASDADKQNAAQLIRDIANQMQKSSKPQSPISGAATRQYPQEWIQMFNEACALYNNGSYFEALTNLKILGKQGYPGALRVIGQAYIEGKGVAKDIGKAYDFLKAAAYRGDTIAVKIIALNLINRDEFGMWKAYAQMKHIQGCEQAHTQGIIEENHRTNTYVHDINAAEAMLKAAECWKNHERHTDWVTTGIGNGGYAAYCHFGKAAGFGNVDGLCGKAAYLELNINEERKNMVLEMYKLAAYCGHSYAMYRVAKYYDSIDISIANKCYRQAAEWGYMEAKNECLRRNII